MEVLNDKETEKTSLFIRSSETIEKIKQIDVQYNLYQFEHLELSEGIWRIYTGAKNFRKIENNLKYNACSTIKICYL